MALVVGLTALASGTFASGSAAFLVRYSGLSAGEVAIGASTAGLVSLLSQMPAAWLVDRLPRRPSWALALLIGGVVYSGYLVVQNLAGYLAILVSATAVLTFASVSKSRWIGDYFEQAGRVRSSAYFRAIQNAGFALGAGLAALILLPNVVAIMSLLPIVAAVPFVAAAALVAISVRSGTLAPRDTPRPSLFAAWKDRPFVLLSAINAAPMINDVLLAVAIPLWLLKRIGGPSWLVPLVLLINTAIVVALQTTVGRSVHGLRSGARAQLRAGVAIAAGCALVATSAAFKSTPEGVVLGSVFVMLGVVVLTMGELLEAAAAWGICYSLAPSATRAQHIATYGLGSEVMQLVAPVGVVGLVTSIGGVGWLIIGAAVAAIAAAAPGAAGFAARHRRQASDAHAPELDL